MNEARPLRRRTVLSVLTAASLGDLAGCLGGADDSALDASENESTTLRVGTQWNLNSLDPLVKGWVFRKLNVIKPLVITDHDASVAPDLVADWSATDKSRQQEFILRDDATFRDGTLLSAALAAESLRRSFASTSSAGPPVESVSATDDRTVRIRTERPFAPLPVHLTRAETSIVSSESYDDDGAVTELIGTGLFRFDSWESDERITAVAFESYHGTVPSIGELAYERVADEQTRLLKLENGELDMARQLSTETTPGLEAHDHLTAYEHEVPRTRYLVFDMTSTPFGDREVRRAVMYALDRAGIVENVLNGGGPAAVGPYPPGLTEWADEDPKPYAYDLEKARELLEAAGWKATESDRVRDGEPLEVELWTHDAWSLPIVAQITQERLSAVGFDVSLRQLTYSTIRERANRDSFDAVLWSNSLLWYSDPDRLTDFVHSTEATMFSGYENERVDRLLEAARMTAHRAERKRRYDEVQVITQRDVPAGWVTHVTNVVGTGTDVEGYRPLPTETRYHLEDVTHQSRA